MVTAKTQQGQITLYEEGNGKEKGSHCLSVAGGEMGITMASIYRHVLLLQKQR